jgi:hypothetical protein
MNGDDELLAKLGDAIGPVEADPPAERISAVRAAAEAARARSLGAVPLADRRTDRAVDPRPVSRPRRQFLTGIAAGAAGLAGGAALWEASDDDPVAGPPTEPLSLRPGGAADSSKAELINHTWGSELVLTGSGYRQGAAHRAVFTDAAGQQVEAGGFTGVGDTEMVCRCTSPLMRDRLRRVEIFDDAGDPVLGAEVT